MTQANCQEVGGSQPALDLNALDKWTYVGRPAISPNGKFAAYLTENEPRGLQTMRIRATEGPWMMKVSGKELHYGQVDFTGDSKYCVFYAGKDSMTVLTLGTSRVSYVPGVSNFTMLKGDKPYVLYELKNDDKKKVVYDVAANKEVFSIHCERYQLSPNGRYLIFQSTGEGADSLLHIMNCYDLVTGSRKTIWTGKEARNMVYDPLCRKMAFIAKDHDGASLHIMCYDLTGAGGQQARELADSAHIPFGNHLNFTDLAGFTHDGMMLYFKAAPVEAVLTPSPAMAKVDVWGYNDAVIQEQQMARNIKPEKELFAVLHLTDGKIFPLCASKDLWWDPSDSNFSDKQLLRIAASSGSINESYWNRTGWSTVTLISAASGQSTIIDSDLPFSAAASYKLSPNGNYVLYFDGKLKQYFSYAAEGGVRRNISAGVDDELYVSEYDTQGLMNAFSRGMIGWVRHTNDVIVRGRDELWRLSLDGSKPPVCITKGYGKANHIQFNVFDQRDEHAFFEEGKTSFISGFNPLTKQNGFFSIGVDGKADPVQLTMDDHAWYVKMTEHSWGEPEPVKSAKANAWLIARQDCNESVNYYLTHDFKIFKPISDNFPERGYNWMKTELVNWTLPDGSADQGVLYKPENFDPNKKYPVVFVYYEEMSNNLHVFLKPERSVCDINIPYYVSNGYLVFTPDIKTTKNGTGIDALHTMESAARKLATFPYVDAQKLGLCGTSMGGYKTNFIASHSHLFAAANPTSGPANISTFVLGLWADGMAFSEVELGQFYIGHSIVERPDLYVTNSPVFYIKNIETPMLMTYNKKDPFNYVDGVALFMGLRRAGKPAWMLQYDGHGHFLDDNDTLATTDLTIRQKQFFDHYLMGKPAPRWMTQGIPYWKKGTEDGLELDPNGVIPAGGVLTPDAQKREAGLVPAGSQAIMLK